MSLPFPQAAAQSESRVSLLDIADSTAIGEVIRGNREMFEVIVRRYNAQLYRVGRSYLRNHEQTEDAMQNAYLKAFLNLNRFHGGAAFGTWLTRIMINECLMMLRRQKKFITETIDGEAVRVPHELATSDIDTLNSDEVKRVLEQSIETLPRAQRSVYLLREVQQLSTAETAACLKLSQENVKVMLHRAREQLKRDLLKSSAGIELFGYSAAYCDPMTARVLRAIRALKLDS